MVIGEAAPDEFPMPVGCWPITDMTCAILPRSGCAKDDIMPGSQFDPVANSIHKRAVRALVQVLGHFDARHDVDFFRGGVQVNQVLLGEVLPPIWFDKLVNAISANAKF